MEKISGDADGIAQLKAIVQENHNFFRVLLEEARTNTDHAAHFTGKDGRKYVFQLDLAHGTISIARAG